MTESHHDDRCLCTHPRSDHRAIHASSQSKCYGSGFCQCIEFLSVKDFAPGPLITLPPEPTEVKPVMPRRTAEEIPTKCEFCNNDRALTGTGKLWRLAVDGEKKVYVRYICEECVMLFSPTHFGKLKRLVKYKLRWSRRGVRTW